MLTTIFISYHFDDKGNQLAEAVNRLVLSHNIKPVTGKRLQGQPLSTGVKKLIDDCQATIVLLSNRDEGKSNQWVKDERAYAEGKGHSIITLLDNELHDDGMFSNYERIRIDWNNLHHNLLDLSETINLWKSQSGNNMKLLLQPEAISEKLSLNLDTTRVKYRIWNDNDQRAPHWNDIQVRPEQGGATIMVSGVKEKDLIEVEAYVNGDRWSSSAVNPNVVVKLKRRES